MAGGGGGGGVVRTTPYHLNLARSASKQALYIERGGDTPPKHRGRGVFWTTPLPPVHIQQAGHQSLLESLPSFRIRQFPFKIEKIFKIERRIKTNFEKEFRLSLKIRKAGENI